MRLMHLADVHLGASYAGFGDLSRERAREVLHAFRRLPEIAAAERVDAVLVAGDLFDGPRAGEDILSIVRDTLRRLVDACIPVFMVPGGHDAVTLKLNPYRELARASRVVVQNGAKGIERRWSVIDEEGRRLSEKHSAYILTEPELGEPVTVDTPHGPLHVYGLAYDRAECREPLPTFRRSGAPGVHVALLHAAVVAPSEEGTSGNSLVVTAEQLGLLEADYIALGQRHGHLPPDAFGGPPACYPGSFAATDLTETGPRGFTLVEVEPGMPPRVEHRDAGVRPVAAAEVDVSACRNDGQALETAARALSPRSVPILRLVGEPAYPLDPDDIAEMMRARYGHAEVVDDTRLFAAGRLEEMAGQDTVAGYVARLGLERIRGAASEPEREVAQRALRVALRTLDAV